ncbi:MAG: ribosome maturation factor RimM [Spirochaetes bacterium]|nr:ribosome maturation factor RimM [Spirochaetota bacterium]
MDVPDYLRIGKIVGAHGLNGRVRIYVVTDITARFNPGNVIYGYRNGIYEALTIAEFVPQKGRFALLAFEGLTSRNEAEPLKGVELFIEGRTAAQWREELDEDSFYYYELVGVDVFLHDEKVGYVSDVLEAGSGNILIITRINGKACMVPFVEPMVDTSRITQNRIDIYPVEGLLDDEG